MVVHYKYFQINLFLTGKSPGAICIKLCISTTKTPCRHKDRNMRTNSFCQIYIMNLNPCGNGRTCTSFISTSTVNGLTYVCISILVSTPVLIRPANVKNGKEVQFSRLCFLGKVLQLHQESCHFARLLCTAAAIYSAVSLISHVCVNHHCDKISVIIIIRYILRLIYEAHIESGFIKC